jgi:fructose-bisphosphate aldolase class I
MLKLRFRPSTTSTPTCASTEGLRVVALSGGYSRDEAERALARNHGVIASFSRALTEGLTAQQSDTSSTKALDWLDRQHLQRRRQPEPKQAIELALADAPGHG